LAPEKASRDTASLVAAGPRELRTQNDTASCDGEVADGAVLAMT
jgi:hypothetical protein